MKNELTKVCAALALFAATAPACAADGFEPPSEIAAGRLAPAALLAGPLHKVKDPVRIEDFNGRYAIQSSYGAFEVSGSDMLATRVAELAAIQSLAQVDKSEAFQKALARSAKAPVDFVTGAVTDPGKTVENVATGIGTVFGRVGRLVTTGANAVADKASDIVSSESKPDGRPAPTGEPEPPAFTGDPFGYNKARREWAQKLNVDPYTTNPVLRAKLNDVATATFSGDFAIGTAVGVVAAPIHYAVALDQTVRDSVWNTPAMDLAAMNEGKLKAMEIEGRPVRDFFRNRWFTPTLQTALVASLEALRGVEGRGAIVEAATSIQGEARARAFIGAVRMLADHHRGAPLRTVRMAGVVGVGSAAGERVVVAAHLDYLWWNEQTAEFAARKDLEAKERILLVSGTTSAAAADALRQARWEVRTGVRPGAAKPGA